LLVSKGTVVTHEDEFGDLRVALASAGSVVQSSQRYAFGGLLLSETAAASATVAPKLQLVGMCLRAGWSFGIMGGMIGEGLPKIFDYDAVFGNKAFWVVAALLDSVLARGLKQIYTRMPSKYYEYVFSCKDFNRLVSYGDQIKDWSHGRWVALLGGKDPSRERHLRCWRMSSLPFARWMTMVT